MAWVLSECIDLRDFVEGCKQVENFPRGYNQSATLPADCVSGRKSLAECECGEWKVWGRDLSKA